MSETCYGKTLTYDYEPGTNKLQEIRRTAGWGAPPVQPGNGQQYNVDAAGRSGSAHKDLHGTTEGFDMVYGDFDRLTGVDLDRDGTVDVEYRYDHRQLRLEKAGGGFNASYSFSTGGLPLNVSNGTENVDYVWLENIPIATVGNTTQILGAGPLGEARRAWDADTTAPTSSTDFTSFGAVSTDADIALPLFPGQLRDEETGLNANWFRTYDPELGGYLRADPIGVFAGDPTLHGYAAANPWSYADPLGLQYGGVDAERRVVQSGGDLLPKGDRLSNEACWATLQGLYYGVLNGAVVVANIANSNGHVPGPPPGYNLGPGAYSDNSLVDQSFLTAYDIGSIAT